MAGDQRAASLAKRTEALGLTLPLLVVTLGVGWLVWSVLEWRQGRTPGYRLVGLRVVRTSDGRPIGWCRSCVRSTICLVLILPTVAACAVIGLCFVFGASPPDDLLRHPRTAPWDYLTRTRVTDERTPPVVRPDVVNGLLRPIDLSRATRPQNNGHAH
jgi:hypothetical protein